MNACTAVLGATKIKVFISYARRDGSDLARRLYADLTQSGLDVWLDTRDYEAGPHGPVKLKRELDSCDVLLALMTQGSYVSEICRAEQLKAMRRGKCVIPLRVQRNADVPLYFEAKNYREFSGDGAYQEQSCSAMSRV